MNPRSLSNEALARAQKKADKNVGAWISRFYANDGKFKAALDLALSLDEEAERRGAPLDEIKRLQNIIETALAYKGPKWPDEMTLREKLHYLYYGRLP